MNCAKKISEEVIKESNQEYDNDLKIVNILNNIEKMVEKKAKRRSPIKLTIEDIFVVYELIRIKITNFREKIFNRDTVAHFILTVFETFFIKNDGLNFENLEEKSAIFDVYIPLRERNLYIICIQRVIDNFPNTACQGYPLLYQHPDAYSQIYAAVAKIDKDHL